MTLRKNLRSDYSYSKRTCTATSARSDGGKKASKSGNNKSKRAVESPATQKPNNRHDATNRQAKTYAKRGRDNHDFEDPDHDDDLYSADFKTNSKHPDEYEESESEYEAEIVKLRRSHGRHNTRSKIGPPLAETRKEKASEEASSASLPIEDEKSTRRYGSRGKKRNFVEIDDTQDAASHISSQGQAATCNTTSSTTAPTKTKTKKRAKKEPEQEDSEMKEIFDSIPTVEAPPPPPKDPDSKWNPFQHKSNAAPPPTAGTKEPPEGADNCLTGLSFVFTGLLETLPREEGQALIKRYGGKVMMAPSSKTSYVILGNDAGPSKLRKIKEYGLRAINEDGLFELIRRLPANGGSGTAATVAQAKVDKEVEQARHQALEMDKKAYEEQMARRRMSNPATSSQMTPNSSKSFSIKISESSKLWTVKYAPTAMSQIVGNKLPVEKLQRWLRNFHHNSKLNFKRGGADGSGIYRAVIISGPPGIGKTTAAHLAAKLEGYDIVESNASDTRSKKLVEDGLKGILSNTSLFGYFSGHDKAVVNANKKLVLIMDEVDGMSAGDRGGVGAMASICKKTSIPIILICNDRRLPKMKPFDHVAYDLKFNRPTTDQIRGRMMTIAFREKLQLPTPVLNALIEGTGADIRQIVNMISTIKLDEADMDYNRSRDMSKAWQKHTVLKPWDIAGKILGGGMFASSSKATLNDKVELYFNDHELSYLFVQENYLSTNPILAASETGPARNLKLLELVEKATDSISDGDLVDRMIHGSQQQWSLMPAHGMLSFVRPASFISGSMGYAQGGTKFPAWLGMNSKQSKLGRVLKQIQGHMRLRCAADLHEIRQDLIPMLWQKLPKRLHDEGREAVPSVINFMDSYFLTREDFDSIQELGVGAMSENGVKIEMQAKAAFTRLYNSQSHPMPFMKASAVLAPKNLTKEKPDLEEALEESDEGEVVEDTKAEEESDLDLKKDNYIKESKKKKPAKTAASKKRAAAAAASDDDQPTASKKSKASGAQGKKKAKK